MGDEEPFEIRKDVPDWYCFHHGHLASEWACHYTDQPEDAADNRKPMRVRVQQVITRWEPEYDDAT